MSVHQTGHNGGFGFGNNYAIRLGLSWDDKPEYFYILNSDAFPEERAIKTLVDYLDGHPTVGIVGSYLHGPDGEPHTSAFRFFSLASEIERNSPPRRGDEAPQGRARPDRDSRWERRGGLARGR